MQARRKSFYQQELESPRGQLSAIWRSNLKATMEIKWFGPANDQFFDQHEKVAEFKQWADGEHAITGVYPERKVLDFIESVNPSLLRLGPPLPTD
jgi:hypothetical protein